MRERLANGLSAPIDEIRVALGRFGPRGWLVAGSTGLATLVGIGLTAAIIDSPLFIRMTPVRSQDYVIWLASALLVGLIAGTFVGPAPAGHGGKTISGGVPLRGKGGARWVWRCHIDTAEPNPQVP